jgi:hypothetical protein
LFTIRCLFYVRKSLLNATYDDFRAQQRRRP